MACPCSLREKDFRPGQGAGNEQLRVVRVRIAQICVNAIP
jgi:hypothetical protein